jgi:hypothetical protein
MYTLVTAIRLILGGFISLLSFAIFVMIELYVVSAAIEHLTRLGYGEYAGYLWWLCGFLIIVEVIGFFLHFIYFRIRNFFKDTFTQ